MNAQKKALRDVGQMVLSFLKDGNFEDAAELSGNREAYLATLQQLGEQLRAVSGEDSFVVFEVFFNQGL